MTVVVDRQDRSWVREVKNEAGGDMMAFSRLKCRSRKSMMREGTNINFCQLIVHPRD